ncbi:hypothetical protein PAECIP111893_02863 [Paenibacillus plantiphilus]|uniref:Uncharacterized protein n=1 Tax=Paenibacillus plantiphilus TaxID=2905650 RepID=A0ABM9CC39_9BACL|nr:hypothetical protein [Paenibacillus plantiphilus]CAH1208230.1 hypothetical protein PAECIP111893_02863 [Paenibacillus plantiphilus]
MKLSNDYYSSFMNVISKHPFLYGIISIIASIVLFLLCVKAGKNIGDVLWK